MLTLTVYIYFFRKKKSLEARPILRMNYTEEQPTHLERTSATLWHLLLFEQFGVLIRLKLGQMLCEETYWSLTNLAVKFAD